MAEPARRLRGTPGAFKGPLQVRGLSLPHGPLDWEWKGQRVRVTLRGPSPELFRLGSSFPADTPLEVESLSRRAARPD